MPLDFRNIPLGGPEDLPTRRKLPATAYLSDGRRVIDYVLAFQPASGGKKKIQMARFRQKFESALKGEGMELEYEGKEKSEDGKTAFVKVHATWDTLGRQAELEDLQMPIQESDLEGKKKGLVGRTMEKIFGRDPFALQKEMRLERKEYFTDAFSREREEQFLIDDHATFFSSAQRAYLTWSVMSNVTISLEIKKKKRKKKEVSYDDYANGGVDQPPEGNVKTVTIQHLLKEGVYSAVFPLHDGECHDDEGENNYEGVPVERWPIRKYLYESWARPGQWYKHQPLEEIRNYYGEKVGLYFAWIGLYTKMLILPSILGVIVFIYGIVSAPFTGMVHDFCDEDQKMYNATLCRDCNTPEVCPFKSVNSFCSYAIINNMFDNPGATAFSIFMAVWAILFLENWKRYQSELCARWDVSDQELGVEQVRADYALSVTTTRLNPITKKHEPYMPKRSMWERMFASFVTVFFFVCVVISLLAAVMIYKVVGPIIWASQSFTKDSAIFSPSLLTSITGSLLNGMFIAVMTKIYMRIAWWLTSIEMPRTETQFEETYTYKVTLFQCANFYGALFYLAFLRGLSPAAPEDDSGFSAKCPPSGCLLDVTIQLAMIMTGKQAINNGMELGMPLIQNFIRKRRNKKKGGGAEEVEDQYTRWEKDYDMNAPPPINLFSDYLEMLIQFGFVTMFVPAFPLAPLFALINNIIEIRLDAYKTLTQTRRCIPTRAKDIGPWFGLLDILTKVAVLTNAALIALTTNFVDFEVFNSLFATNSTTAGSKLEFMLSTMSTDSLCTGLNASIIDGGNYTMEAMEERCLYLKTFNGIIVDRCYYRDYRDPVTQEHTLDYYKVMFSKLLFILIFEHFVIICQGLIGYMIPDVPDHVTMRLQREAFLQRQAFKEHEYGEGYEEAHKVEEFEELEDFDGTRDESFNLDSFAGKLPPGVSVNQFRKEIQEPPRRRPFIYTAFKKLMFC